MAIPSKEYTEMSNKTLGVYTCNRKCLNNEKTFDTLFGDEGCKTDGLELGKKKHFYDSHQKSTKTTINKLMQYDNTIKGYDILSGKPTQNNYNAVSDKAGEKREFHGKHTSDMNAYFYNK